jgi:hypothetical protein
MRAMADDKPPRQNHHLTALDLIVGSPRIGEPALYQTPAWAKRAIEAEAAKQAQRRPGRNPEQIKLAKKMLNQMFGKGAWPAKGSMTSTQLMKKLDLDKVNLVQDPKSELWRRLVSEATMLRAIGWRTR